MDSETEKRKMKFKEFRRRLGDLILEAADNGIHPEIVAGQLYVAASKVTNAYVSSQLVASKLFDKKDENESSAN